MDADCIIKPYKIRHTSWDSVEMEYKTERLIVRGTHVSVQYISF